MSMIAAKPTPVASESTGTLLIGEYGNVASTAYRVMRSTDDGLTWSAVLTGPGTDPLSDPGHIHSVRWDKYRSVLLAFMDRPNPELYTSANQGATWTKIGTSTTPTMPNFVTAMFFADHVAWGYDNQLNGQISRLSAADFYAGRWSDVETVAQLDHKAFYQTFPLREDVWLIAQATELIGATDAAYGPGSYACAAYLVDQDGARVSAGIEHLSPASQMGALGGHVIGFSNFNHASYDHAGKTLLNLPNAGLPYPSVLVPASMGVNVAPPPTAQAAPGPVVLHNDVGVYARDTAGTLRQVVVFDGNNRVRMSNPYSPALPEVRLYEGATGIINMMFNGATVAGFISDGRMQMTTGKYIEMGSTTGAPRIYSGTGTPEGVQAAPPGSLWLNWSGGAGTSLYVKQTGTGNTGWVGK